MESQSQTSILVFLIFFIMVISVCGAGTGSNVTGVTYDRRSLIVNGQRQLFFSGSIHYPRSTPEVLHFTKHELTSIKC